MRQIYILLWKSDDLQPLNCINYEIFIISSVKNAIQQPFRLKLLRSNSVMAWSFTEKLNFSRFNLLGAHIKWDRLHTSGLNFWRDVNKKKYLSEPS